MQIDGRTTLTLVSGDSFEMVGLALRFIGPLQVIGPYYSDFSFFSAKFLLLMNYMPQIFTTVKKI